MRGYCDKVPLHSLRVASRSRLSLKSSNPCAETVHCIIHSSKGAPSPNDCATESHSGPRWPRPRASSIPDDRDARSSESAVIRPSRWVAARASRPVGPTREAGRRQAALVDESVKLLLAHLSRPPARPEPARHRERRALSPRLRPIWDRLRAGSRTAPGRLRLGRLRPGRLRVRAGPRPGPRLSELLWSCRALPWPSIDGRARGPELRRLGAEAARVRIGGAGPARRGPARGSGPSPLTNGPAGSTGPQTARRRGAGA